MNAAPRVQPFPWRALASTTRAEARAQQGLRLAAERFVRVGDVTRALGDLVQARVEVLPRSARSAGAAGDGLGVLLTRADDARAMCLVEVEPGLGAALSARALRRKPPALIAPERDGTAVAGALGALLVAASRRAHAGAPLAVRSAGRARDLVGLLGADVAVTSFTVLVEDEAFLARVAVPRATVLGAARPPFDRAALASLGDTPLSLPVVAAASLAAAAEVAALAAGDAWMPGGWSLGLPSRGRLAGRVTLAAPGAREGLAAELGAEGGLVFVGERVGLSMEGRDGVGEAVGQALGDVPVLVRVELGSVEMRARDWAALGPGDVLPLGVRAAEPVVLRVGGVEVARGELVEIDGEVGVRLVSRRGAGA